MPHYCPGCFFCGLRVPGCPGTGYADRNPRSLPSRCWTNSCHHTGVGNANPLKLIIKFSHSAGRFSSCNCAVQLCTPQLLICTAHSYLTFPWVPGHFPPFLPLYCVCVSKSSYLPCTGWCHCDGWFYVNLKHAKVM